MSYIKEHPVVNLVGQKFNRLTVVEFSHVDKWSKDIWKCQCECGNTTYQKTYSLVNNKVFSCGCYQSDVSRVKHTKHLSCDTRLYRIYNNMKNRCYRSSNPKFPNYGGRGIVICDEWLGDKGFTNFYAWAIANGYKDNLSIDRINNDGNYEPSNCRWTTNTNQARNRRNSFLITVDNETKTLAEWCEIKGLPYSTMSHRIKKLGWSGEKAFNTPIKGRK